MTTYAVWYRENWYSEGFCVESGFETYESALKRVDELILDPPAEAGISNSDEPVEWLE